MENGRAEIHFSHPVVQRNIDKKKIINNNGQIKPAGVDRYITLTVPILSIGMMEHVYDPVAPALSGSTSLRPF